MEGSAAHTLTAENFKADVLEFAGAVLIDFWAPWCGPCRAMAPRIEELAEKYKGNSKVRIAKLNVDEAGEIASQFQVLSIPTFSAFAGGKLVGTLIGVRTTADLETLIEKALQSLPIATA